MKNQIAKILPKDIRSNDSLDNITSGFLEAMKDILDTQCLMLDKNSYIDRKKVTNVTLPKGWKVL